MVVVVVMMMTMGTDGFKMTGLDRFMVDMSMKDN